MNGFREILFLVILHLRAALPVRARRVIMYIFHDHVFATCTVLLRLYWIKLQEFKTDSFKQVEFYI